MYWYGFRHYRLPLSRFFTNFPFRGHTLFSRHVSTAPKLSYWYRPHRSKTRLPILFIHGIGVGIHTYTSFCKLLVSHLSDKASSDDDEVGIIVIELMPISMRVTVQALDRETIVSEIAQILAHHEWNEKIVLAAHSYGTMIAAHLLHSPTTRNLIGPMCLIDPVTLSIHLGEVPINFIYRKPRLASEHQLNYFACRELGTAHAITRRFDWSQMVMWKDEIQNRKVTLVLSGKDIIFSAERLGCYLTSDPSLWTPGSEDADNEIQAWKNRKWRGEGLDILWYNDLNHAEVFDTKSDIEPLIEAITCYTRKSPPLIVINGD